MKRKYIIETIIFFTYALFAFSWVSGSMMDKSITADFDISGISATTWSTNAITTAKIIGNLLASWFLIRLMPKKAFAFASFLIVCGVIGAWATSYPFYVVSRLIMGFGGAFVIVYFSPIILHYFNAEERPLINGINSIAFNTGNLLALLFTSSLLSFYGSWRSVLIFIAVCSLILLALWFIFSEDFVLGQSAQTSTQQKDYTLSEGVKDSFNWILPLCYSGILFAYIAIFSLFPKLPSFAVDPKDLSALMIGAGMVGTLVGIVVTKKYAFRVPLIRFGGLAMSASLALMILTKSPTLAYLGAFCAGFFMFLPMTAMLTIPLELPQMTPGRATVVFGMFWSISYGIETIWMYFAGLLADNNPFYAALFVLICSLSAFISSFFLPETGKVKTA